MSQRTAEGDVLQEMGSKLNDTISKQSTPERFGSVMSSAGFVSDFTVEAISTTGGISNYDKVIRIMSAVKDYITTSGRVTQEFDQFIILLYDKLRLDRLAQELVEKLKGRKPGYQSPLMKGASGSSCVSSAESLEEKVSTEVQAFSTTMTADKLCSWLRFNQLPESDCQIILGKSIGGRAFKHLTKEEWSSYGISDIGLIVLRDIIGEMSSSVNPSQKAAANTSFGSDVANTALSQGREVVPHGNPRTVVERHHYGILCEKLRECAPNDGWKSIAAGLRFTAPEIAGIASNLTHMVGGPGSYMNAVISVWMDWGPGDARGSKDVATLEALKAALRKDFGRVALNLTLEDS